MTISRRSRLPLIAACAAAAAFAVAGCEGSVSVGNNLDTDKAEREITKGIEEQTGVKSTVACPDDVEIKQGDTFECTATPEGGGEPGTVTVTQKDDEGNISWSLK